MEKRSVNERLVGRCNRRVFIYWARIVHVARFGKVWIFHTHLTWFTSECRLIPPPYSSGAAGAQDPHERSAKEEETCLKCFSLNIFIFSDKKVPGQASMGIYPSKIIYSKGKSLRKEGCSRMLLPVRAKKETRERKTGRSLISEKFKIFFIRCSKEIASRPRMLVTSRWPFLTSGSHDRNVVLNIKLPATSRVFA